MKKVNINFNVDYYNIEEIVKTIIEYSIKISKPVDNMKIQKLLYYIQAYTLKHYNRPLFNEKILAYQYGPLVKEAYDIYKMNVGADIYYVHNRDKLKELDGFAYDIVTNIIEKYKDVSSWKIAMQTHEEDPWKNVNYKEVISLNSIKEYFDKIKDF